MTKTSRYGFQTVQERETEQKNEEEAGRPLREKRTRIAVETAQRIGPLIRDSLAEYFRSMNASTVDDTGAEQVALFKEEAGIRGHTWTAWSKIKTGIHSDYRADGVHLLDEETAYTITVSLVVNHDGLPLLHIGDYARSKLVGGSPVVDSHFLMEIPSQLAGVLETETGIKQVSRAEFLDAQVH
ncbi:MAG: hypothetical protein M1132_06525 [Chloroflexi bacterium]|nr:hypothetical protein [Chloroflexota bacterium]MCL5951364.1 hypothetical protein [Chloroflexota bacterium]